MAKLSYLYIVRNRVREQRTQRGLSQAELAAAVEVSRQTVISIESGRTCRRCRWRSGSRFLDVTVDKMFDQEGEVTGT
jgi:putative transcriptional regulator